MENIEKIKNEVQKVISYSQGIDTPKVDKLIETWYAAKKPFIQAFGNELIWESPIPVSFKLDKEEKTKRISDFSKKIFFDYNNKALHDFIEDNTDSFFENKVENSYSYNGKLIPKGMKLVKAFKYFEQDPTKLNSIQSQASQIIQEDKVEGTLCFSVHPLDFLSSSENTYNWRSCHALDGDYRAGNLSYMEDNVTIICYIKGAEEEFLPNFGDVKWNSKKWRVLMFVSKDRNFIAPGRQYPFTTSTGMKQTTDLFLKVLGQNPKDFYDLTDFCIDSSDMINTNEGKWLYSPYIWINGRLYAKAEIIKDDSSLHFNDLLKSHCYIMQYRTKKLWHFHPEAPSIHIGHEVFCLCCGKSFINRSETMMCDDCELQYGVGENDVFAYCDCCGNRFFRDDGVFVRRDDGNEDFVCPNCRETECFVCSDCGEFYYDIDGVYDEEADDHVCFDCYESRCQDRKEDNDGTRKYC